MPVKTDVAGLSEAAGRPALYRVGGGIAIGLSEIGPAPELLTCMDILLKLACVAAFHGSACAVVVAGNVLNTIDHAYRVCEEELVFAAICVEMRGKLSRL